MITNILIQHSSPPFWFVQIVQKKWLFRYWLVEVWVSYFWSIQNNQEWLFHSPPSSLVHLARLGIWACCLRYFAKAVHSSDNYDALLTFPTSESWHFPRPSSSGYNWYFLWFACTTKVPLGFLLVDLIRVIGNRTIDCFFGSWHFISSFSNIFFNRFPAAHNMGNFYKVCCKLFSTN